MTFKEWWREQTKEVPYWYTHEEEIAKKAWNAALKSKWQPIETVPRDGTNILVYFKPHGWLTVSWGDGIWEIDDYKHGPFPLRGYREGDDTHWMPLPEPPPENV